MITHLFRSIQHHIYLEKHELYMRHRYCRPLDFTVFITSAYRAMSERINLWYNLVNNVIV